MKSYKVKPTIRKKNRPALGDFVTFTDAGRAKKVTKPKPKEIMGIYVGDEAVLAHGVAIVKIDNSDEDTT